MPKFEFDEQFVTALLNYLGDRPYKEVFRLISQINISASEWSIRTNNIKAGGKENANNTGS